MAEQLRKGIPMLSSESLIKLDETLKTNSANTEELLVALYYHTHDPVQMILIEEICRIRGFVLEVEVTDPPLMVG
jgi:hypothetical protein